MRETTLHGKDGEEFTIPVRPGLPVTAPSGRYPGFRQETLLLKKGSIRMKGAMPLPCDILLERDVPITLRDGITIYADIFRPPGSDNLTERVPAILALSPYGKEVGSQWLDDIPMRAGVPRKATSGLQKFEGPDPAYWVNHGYAIVNPDVRGAYSSQGVVLFFGSDYGRDGADIVEFAAAQAWCNGKVGMSGNSWLAISQWFTAAQNPQHLAAIAPWEGLSDCYREVAARGGIPMPEFIGFLTDSFASTESGGVEDTMATMRENQLMNRYWDDKMADLAAITVPAYVVASYTNPIHTYGSFEGFCRISSNEKWLRVHNSSEWPDYYDPDNVEDLRRFFDRYLKGIDNGWQATPKVRLSVLNLGGRDIVGRPESEWPLARTEFKRLYLDASNGTMGEIAPLAAGSVEYGSGSKRGAVSFRYRMPDAAEITGYMKLRLWVQAPDSDDMDLEVKIDKLNAFGFKPFSLAGLMVPTSATGYMRVSLRELDPDKSTDSQPYQTMAREQRLKDGEIVAVDMGIWPTGMLFKRGECLRVRVQAYKTADKGFAIPFGKKPVKIPATGFTFMPGQKIGMVTLGTGEPVPSTDAEMPKDRNKGRHVLHTGGKHESYLLVPFIPPKRQ